MPAQVRVLRFVCGKVLTAFADLEREVCPLLSVVGTPSCTPCENDSTYLLSGTLRARVRSIQRS